MLLCWRKSWPVLTRLTDELSRLCVGGRRLEVVIKNSSGEIIAGNPNLVLSLNAYEYHSLPSSQGSTASPSVMDASPVVSPSPEHYRSNTIAAQTVQAHLPNQYHVDQSESFIEQHAASSLVSPVLQAASVSQMGYVSMTPTVPTTQTYVVTQLTPTQTMQPSYTARAPPYYCNSQTVGLDGSPTVSAVTPNPSYLELIPPQQQSPKTVYIQNVHYQATWKDLKDHLRTRGGHVDHCKIFTEEDGRSKGRAIATFRTSSEAQRAVRDLDGKKFQGKRLKVTMNNILEKNGELQPESLAELELPCKKHAKATSADRRLEEPVVVDGSRSQLALRTKC
jgi:hypothetical protein